MACKTRLLVWLWLAAAAVLETVVDTYLESSFHTLSDGAREEPHQPFLHPGWRLQDSVLLP